MIYVITHKVFENRLDKELFKILHVGLNTDCETYYLRDDCGDNIAYKNKNYCELTGMYWIWKNCLQDSHYVGICHYRRYFTNRKYDIMNAFLGLEAKPQSKYIIEKKLQQYDIILPKKIRICRSVKQHYSDMHYQKDIDLVRDVISELYPLYNDAFDKVMASHYYYHANMMVCNSQIYSEYCEWLFSILFEVERRVDITTYDTYQARIFGFLSERLISVWILYNRLRVCEMPIYNTDRRRMTMYEVNIRRISKGIKKTKIRLTGGEKHV